MRGKVILWVVLAALYISLAVVNWNCSIEIKEKVGGIWVGKEKIIVGKPSELNETEKAEYIDLANLFYSSAIINAVGFLLAAFAAALSAKW